MVAHPDILTAGFDLRVFFFFYSVFSDFSQIAILVFKAGFKESLSIWVLDEVKFFQVPVFGTVHQSPCCFIIPQIPLFACGVIPSSFFSSFTFHDASRLCLKKGTSSIDLTSVFWNAVAGPFQ